MARMIPSTVHSSVQSGAERRMFGIIAGSPRSDGWVCLHSLGLARHVSKRRGEIDFLLLCRFGIFVLEVKGGRVQRRDGIWTFTNKYGEVFKKVEGPFDQASSAMFSLEKKVKNKFKDSPMAETLFGYGVVLPDVKFEEVGSDSDPALVYDIRDRRRSFDTYVSRLAEFTRSVQTNSRKGLKLEQIHALAEFLRGDFDLVPAISTVIEDTNEQLINLTRQQFAVLDSLESEPRVIVDGVAGSGKTLLALESARRAARKGQHVLLLCYNHNLAARLARHASSEKYPGSIYVKTLHGFCRDLIRQSTLEDEFTEQCASLPRREVFDRVYLEYATLAVLDRAIARFDMIILDEAQDVLTGPVVELLGNCIRGGLENGQWQIFLDSVDQASVYGRMDPIVNERVKHLGVLHVLTFNCRNTKQIAMQTEILSGSRRPFNAQADGLPVEICTYASDRGWVDILANKLKELAGIGVAMERVIVLVPKIPTGPQNIAFQELGLVRLDDKSIDCLGSTEWPQIYWSSISGYKGLESDVAILAGLEEIEEDWWKSIAYVGMSRAKVRLIVLLNEECEPVRALRVEAHLRNGYNESEFNL